MHGMCSETSGNMTRLAKCPRDFVEAPSQMLENWCWNPTVLRRLSSHYQSGEPLSDTLLSKLVAAKNLHVALMTLRQVYLSKLDFALHFPRNPDHLPNEAEIQTTTDTLKVEVSLIKNPEGCNMLRSFGHLMNQYSAAYYGYLWSEVLSADMFSSRFEKEGVMSRTTGLSYRKRILAPGGIGKISEHLAEFLGREPSQQAFLRGKGIATSDPTEVK